LSRERLLYRLPTARKLTEEKVLLGKFTDVARKLGKLDKAVECEELEKLVNEELGMK
jgi:hypothetical protein